MLNVILCWMLNANLIIIVARCLLLYLLFHRHQTRNIIISASPKSEYKLPWTYLSNSSLTRIKCPDGQEFEALQSGRFLIKVSLHVNTHQWIGKEDLDRQFSVRLCLNVATMSRGGEYCISKIQSPKEVDNLHFSHLIQLTKGQKFSIYLSTQQKLKNIIRSSGSEMNTLQILLDDCTSEWVNLVQDSKWRSQAHMTCMYRYMETSSDFLHVQCP